MPTITTVDATWETGATLDAAELRRADSAMFLGDGSPNGVRGGIVRHGDNSLAVSVNGSDQVSVQAGAAVIPAATGLGVYRASIASGTSAVAIDSRNATNPRIDLVVFRSTGAVDIITGTPGSSPSAPALPSGAIELARLGVPAAGGGAVTVTTSFRQYAAALGGTIPVETAARLPGSGNQKGQRAVALDTGLEHVWNGTAWVGSGWTTFALNIVNLPLAAASSYAVYKQVDNLTFVEFAGVASSGATGELSIQAPVAPVIRQGSNNRSQAWGQALATDSGVAPIPVTIYCRTPTTVGFITPSGAAVGTTVPFTWDAGDTLAGSFCYESA